MTTTSFVEKRLDIDGPLTPEDIRNFEKFHQDFLGKGPEDRMGFLKVMALFRRGDLREFCQAAVVFQARYKQLMPVVKQRDLLLSFPSVTRNLHNLIFDFSESYGGIEGVTTVRMAKDQVTDHLDRTEMFRLDVDKAMEIMPSMLPQDRRMLAEFADEIASGRTPDKTFRFLLVILADHPFLGVLPGTERSSTMVVGKIREFLEQKLGDRFDDHIIEFFIAGGGYLRYEDGFVLLGGHNAVFDPNFAEPDDPLTAEYKRRFAEKKFHVVQQILATEFPGMHIRCLT